MPNLTFLAPAVLEIWRESQNFKSKSLDPFLTLFAFFSLVPLVMNLYVKFEVSSSNRSPDMKGVPKFQK